MQNSSMLGLSNVCILVLERNWLEEREILERMGEMYGKDREEKDGVMGDI